MPATKQYKIERPPLVLCIQLKRFNLMRGKNGRPLMLARKINISNHARWATSTGIAVEYRLVSMSNHVGPSPNCGHYTSIGEAANGTFYRFDDASGGSMDIARKANRWDDKHVSTLSARKEELSEEMRQAMKSSRKESEIQTIQSQVQGLETRLKYSLTDKDATNKKIDKLEKEMEKMRKELEQFAPKIREIEATMRKREQQIEGTKDKMNTVEDRVFKDFCRKIGVSNIRQYEERELKTQQERAKKKLEFENQINRITTQLEYEQKREDQLQENVTKFERMVQVIFTTADQY